MRLLSRIRWLLRCDPAQKELDEEIRVHLELDAEARIEAGDSPDEARAAARRDFGNVGLAKEDARSHWGLTALELLWQDLRYAARGLLRDPRFTAVAVLSLALGIGANTAIFSLIHALILRSLPVENAGGLVELSHQYTGDPRLNAYGIDAFEHMRDHSEMLSALIASTRPEGVDIVLDDSATVRADCEFVSGSYFQVLGLEPAIGRLLGPDDDSSTAPVAVASWTFWHERLRGDTSAIGRTVSLNGHSLTIVGVAPPEFFGVEAGFESDLWSTLAIEELVHPENRRAGVRLLARLTSGVSHEQAAAELKILFDQKQNPGRRRDDPLLRAMTIEVSSAAAGVGHLRYAYSKPLLFLMGVVVLLLLIACTNVASMMVARGATRERELALRVSLGAGRLRLARMALAESLLLGIAGAGLGVLAAYGLSSALVRIIESGRRPIELTVDLDAGVLLFTAGAALLTTLLFGSAPALRAMAVGPAGPLRISGRGGETKSARALRKGLVAAQVSLSVLLLSAAGLFVDHLSSLRNGLGFEREGLLLLQFEDPRAAARRAEELRVVIEKLESLPGVQFVAGSATTPLSGAGANFFGTVEGFQESAGERRAMMMNGVGPRFFETIGTPLLAGRSFSYADAPASKPLIVNEAFVRYYCADGRPLGKRVTLDGQTEPFEIVGVVADAAYLAAGEPMRPTIYRNTFVELGYIGALTLQTHIPPASLAAAVRRTLDESLPGLEIDKTTTMAAQVDETLVPERLAATLSSAFGGLGALLTAIGLFGLLGYMVSRRTNEIGIRAALGATAGDSIRMVLREAALVTAIGLCVGSLAAYWCRSLAPRVFEGLEAATLWPILWGVLALVLAAGPAAIAPAIRAARISPMEALRTE